ncbi:MAG: hypothetical protein JNK04_15630, partial [Myxococcales bacterium]|nr:hypothetical protein [Myxococcales bacterium]
LTLRGASESTVLLGGGKDVVIEQPRLCDVHIVDGGLSFVRSTADGGWVDCGRVEASSFTLTDEGRQSLCGSGTIVSGLSVAGGRGWVVTDSDVTDFYCSSPSPAAAREDCDLSGGVGIAFNLGSRDTLIERTRFIGVSRGIVLGYTTTPTAPRAYADNPYDDNAIDHFDGVLRNNVIVGHPLCFDTGIELNHAREPSVLHNTVIHLQEAGYSAIDRRYTETRAALINNLVYGAITFRNNAPVETDVGTVALDGLGEIFLDPSAGDCHLRAGASAVIDKGEASDLAGLDIDGEAHEVGSAPDVGADEYTP